MTLKYSRELSNLEYEEINRILKQLSNSIRRFLPLLIEYQEFLSDIDVVAAKAKYANRINEFPTITEDRRMYFRDAYHQLYLNNKQKNTKLRIRKQLN
jgi:DNA mismatch repair protein MutS2